MSLTTIAFTLIAIAARQVLADDTEVDGPSPTTQSVMNATLTSGAAAGASPTYPRTLLDNAVPYCTFSGVKLSCAPLTTHQKLFVILSGLSLALLFILLMTLCCCCCCGSRRTRKSGPPSIYVSSSSNSLENGPQTSQAPANGYYGAYGGQAPYGSRLNGERLPAGSGSGGTGGKDTDKRQAVYGREYSRT